MEKEIVSIDAYRGSNSGREIICTTCCREKLSNCFDKRRVCEKRFARKTRSREKRKKIIQEEKER